VRPIWLLRVTFGARVRCADRDLISALGRRSALFDMEHLTERRESLGWPGPVFSQLRGSCLAQQSMEDERGEDGVVGVPDWGDYHLAAEESPRRGDGRRHGHYLRSRQWQARTLFKASSSVSP
jgi:hypothetical protein